MVVVDIDIIHGDHLVKPASPNLFSLKAPNLTQSLQTLGRANPDATAIRLTTLMGRAVHRIELKGQKILLDTLNGQPVPNIDRSLAERLARNYYAGSGDVEQSILIEDNPPSEIGSRPLPLWLSI